MVREKKGSRLDVAAKTNIERLKGLPFGVGSLGLEKTDTACNRWVFARYGWKEW